MPARSASKLKDMDTEPALALGGMDGAETPHTFSNGRGIGYPRLCHTSAVLGAARGPPTSRRGRCYMAMTRMPRRRRA